MRVAVAVLVVATLFQLLAAGSVLKKYPHLMCSACHAATEELFIRMNATSQKTSKQRFQVSHRLKKDNSIDTVDYETSELRAIEIMEGLCGKLPDHYRFVLRDDKVRWFSRNKTLENAPTYSPTDHDQLKEPEKLLKEYCFDIFDDYDEDIVALVRFERSPERFTHKLCHDTVKVCAPKRIESSLQKDKHMHEKDEERKRRKQAAEEAKKAKENDEGKSSA